MRLGTRVSGRYRLKQGPLPGGTAEVWLAHDETLGRDVILKRLTPTPTPRFDRLKSEARVLARFTHPHVVTLHDTVHLGKGSRATTWLVMEYVPGGSLDDRPPLPPRLAAHLGAQIADGLVALHAAGIVHGDIKPGNVVVTQTPAPTGPTAPTPGAAATPSGPLTAKLADFGAAYRVDGKETITPNSAVSYTPDYASPEVVRGQPEPASDVFSLAATVYALAAGHPPRRGAGAAEPGRAEADADRDPDPRQAAETEAFLAARRAARGDVDLSADVGPLLEPLTAMLQRMPHRRPTAAEARELLREIAGDTSDLPPLPPQRRPATGAGAPARPNRRGHAAGSAVAAAPAAGTPADGARPYRAGRFRRPGRTPLIAAAAALVVLAAAVISWALTRSSGDDGGSAAPPATGASAHAAPRTAGPTGRTGPAGPTGTAAGADASAAGSVFGDHRTVDPCSLLAPAALRTYGSTRLDPAYGNFDRCDVIVGVAKEGPVDVEVELEAGPQREVEGTTSTTGSAPGAAGGGRSVRTVREQLDGDECDRELSVSGDGRDGAYVTVTAKPQGDNTPSGALLCRMADTAARSAAATLAAVPAKGTLPRRSPVPPADSLAHQDACTLLDAHALGVVPGVDADDPDIGFGNWRCSWRSTTSDTYVQVFFDRGEPPTADDGTATRLHGRTAFVAPPDEEGDHTALVMLPGRAFTAADGTDGAETVRVVVGGETRTDAELRSMAVELATAAAGALSPAGGAAGGAAG
ncbi:serine/threonine-protein kinase [Actinacidiphila sp. DG2A-62]|uniref:serine/threonine-protein kinase n=1 Tax=Actinacidiphila sp. DG2A-62 TaxID=3108821 RepID=UPI002DB7A3BB|nr:serine/threonine-protein kinase [Actinacidiphila sp. DG2A-62]MEC3994944.1 serine/threonine-protein kinase [Actinacidiphila sp. DG2A-62]